MPYTFDECNFMGCSKPDGCGYLTSLKNCKEQLLALNVSKDE